MATKLTAADLRVGNLVNTPNKSQNPFRVDYFDEHKVYQKNGTYDVGEIKDIPFHPLTWDIEDLEPIPLTEEIAIKLGFKSRKGDGWLVLRICDYVFYYKSDVHILQIERRALDLDLYDGVAYFSNNDNYVHTLQNLVKALTNTELTLKEDKQL